MAITNPFANLSSEAQAAIIQGGLGIGGNILSGIAQGKQNDRNQAFDLASVLANLQQRQNEMALLDQQFREKLAADKSRTAVDASQFDPLAQQKSRANFGIDRELYANARPVETSFDPASGMGKISGGFTIPQGGFSPTAMQMFSPESAANAEAQFHNSVTNATGAPPPNLGGMGYGGASANADTSMSQNLANQVATRSSLPTMPDPMADLRAMQQTQGAKAGTKYNPATGMYEEEKKKGGFLRTLGKIASVAAPIIAAPFTGGATLALIGAGAGAAGGALSGGGVKGALMGAGLGAIPGLGTSSGAAGSAASMGAGAALKNAIVNPRSIAALAGAALPGKAGAAAQLASMLLPGAQSPAIMNQQARAAGALAQPGAIAPNGATSLYRPPFVTQNSGYWNQ